MWWFVLVIAIVILAILTPSKTKKSKENTEWGGGASEPDAISIRVTAVEASSAIAGRSSSLITGEPVTHGLIIAQPWIGMILRGEKSWEMRSQKVKRRGAFALIEKGTGTVVGLASLTDVQGPLNFEQLAEHQDLHRVPANIYQAAGYKWNYAWVLQDVQALPNPVPYQHKNGAVTWVLLNEEAQEGIATQLNPDDIEPEAADISYQESNTTLVPVAQDGTLFFPRLCMRNGCYTVGEKDDEKCFTDYEQALNYLKSMPIAKWHRPDENSNWGMVSAVDWVKMRVHYS